MISGYRWLALSALMLLTLSCEREERACTDEELGESNVNNSYDSTYAQHLGADEYGMKSYVMAFLKTGPNRDQDSVTKAKLQRAHLDNINRLAAEGKLVMAGPFLDEGDIRGIYLFAVPSIEEAERLTATDPAIKAGSLIMELHPWYGSAAIMEVNEIHKQIAKIAI